MIKLTGSISSIFFCYYMFRDENLLIDFLLKNAHKMTLGQQKNLYWIGVLNLNLRLRNQYKPDNNLHIPLIHDLIWDDSKIWSSDMRVYKWQVCELQAKQFTICNSTNL